MKPLQFLLLNMFIHIFLCLSNEEIMRISKKLPVKRIVFGFLGLKFNFKPNVI